MGMTVIYCDVINLMAMGTARQVPTLNDLLAEADFVTLHVPDLPETRRMMSHEQFAKMKTGSYLINASRGTVVDIPALIDAMSSGKVAGAALDVYPNEPAANGDYFNNDLNNWGEQLRALKNLILTPHIGGSTEEAQRAIGVEGNSRREGTLPGWPSHPCSSAAVANTAFLLDSQRCSRQVHQPGCHGREREPARGEPPVPDSQ